MPDKRKEYTDPFILKQGKLLEEQATSQYTWGLDLLHKKGCRPENLKPEPVMRE